MTFARQLLVSLSLGALLAAGWFLLCAWIGSLPAISDVSLSRAFQPWYRPWVYAVVLFAAPTVLVILLRVRRALLDLRN